MFGCVGLGFMLVNQCFDSGSATLFYFFGLFCFVVVVLF